MDELDALDKDLFFSKKQVVELKEVENLEEKVDDLFNNFKEDELNLEETTEIESDMKEFNTFIKELARKEKDEDS